ncbi:hypothetical protein AJ80_02243 [Polytolypa hystricis UAMH7299]|uniref:Uncharacterized protein n=1 Tax=Polytolypa hystricis (strain UAMH7299) TaxID=1447883 RepID=A0A2B7YSP3_POLH7|nr:hypothetical protein AJ80_02243 [Polytolypa hystricis UAMH7299]
MGWPVAYNFSPDIVEIPAYMKEILPTRVYQLLTLTVEAAETCYSEHIDLEYMYETRFRHMFDLSDWEAYYANWKLIERILDYDPQQHIDPVTGLPVKLPRNSLNLLPAYKYDWHKFDYEWLDAHDEYFRGPRRAWDSAKDYFEEVLMDAEMSHEDGRVAFMWWARYVTEMEEWEDVDDEMWVPSWDEVVEELTNLVKERVDVGEDWELEMFVDDEDD